MRSGFPLIPLLILASFGSAARAQDVLPLDRPDRVGARADSAVAPAPAPADSGVVAEGGPWHRKPRWIMFRSLAVPGWGQWANGKHVKAAVVGAGEGYLIWRAVDYGRQEGEKADEARLAAGDPDRQAKLLERKRYYGSRRRDFTWWSVFAAVLSMGDAYVDAQLGPFDPEFRPQDGIGGIGLGSGAGFRFGLKVRLP